MHRIRTWLTIVALLASGGALRAGLHDAPGAPSSGPSFGFLERTASPAAEAPVASGTETARPLPAPLSVSTPASPRRDATEEPGSLRALEEDDLAQLFEETLEIQFESLERGLARSGDDDVDADLDLDFEDGPSGLSMSDEDLLRKGE